MLAATMLVEVGLGMEWLEPELGVSWGLSVFYASLTLLEAGARPRCSGKNSEGQFQAGPFFLSVHSSPTNITSALVEISTRATGARAHTQYGLWCTLGCPSKPLRAPCSYQSAASHVCAGSCARLALEFG